MTHTHIWGTQEAHMGDPWWYMEVDYSGVLITDAGTTLELLFNGGDCPTRERLKDSQYMIPGDFLK